jgi:hypothetical protein
MRHDELDVGIAVRNLPGDQVEDKGRVLERGADRGGVFVVVDEWRADAGDRRVGM